MLGHLLLAPDSLDLFTAAGAIIDHSQPRRLTYCFVPKRSSLLLCAGFSSRTPISVPKAHCSFVLNSRHQSML
jgi:hypothetical protein